MSEMFSGETSIFGVRVFESSIPQATGQLMAHAGRGGTGVVCIANVDMVTRAVSDGLLADIMRKALLVVTDGMPLVWALKRDGAKNAERVYGPDFMLDLVGKAEAEAIPIFLYGGSEYELLKLKERLLSLFPQLRIVGAISPPMLPLHPTLDSRVVSTINGSGAKLVFVGLGCPKQEYWMRTHSPHLNSITLGVGLAFAQIAGLKTRAPRWMQRFALEWIFRLFQEPRRLWRRYLVGNSLFVWYCLRGLATKGNFK